MGAILFGMQDSKARAEGNSPPKIGAHIEDFKLRDFRGREHSLSGLSEARVVVVTFLGTECPLAKLYGRKLNTLQKQYHGQSVEFLGINSNRQDSISELAEYARLHETKFPLLKDAGNRVADSFGAQRTPQVFVLDEARNIRYYGAIDNQYGIGRQRDESTQDYLANAIDEILSGKSVATSVTTAVGCIIGRVPSRDATGDVTYTKDIAPLLNRNCVECHREGELAPFPLETYGDVLGWEDMMVEVIADNRMPPWFANPAHGEFKNDARLSDDEKNLFRQWVANGSPEGNASDLPSPPEFRDGWRIQTPDQVVYMSDQPYQVPAEGVVDYQYYSVDPGWKEDKYIVAAEARPGNREAVHHIIAYLVPPGEQPRKDKLRAMLVGYAPGSPPNVLNEGRAVHVPAGSTLLFEMHYTPIGSVQQDLSYVGFRFTEAEKVKQLVRGRAAVQGNFAIPPHAENHEVVAEYTAKQDELLLRMSPHMHLRGKAFRYDAVFPGGRQETLLDVPAYDFNWQLSYHLAEPKLLPAGTKIICTAHYDNSKNNLANPDADAEVRWGQQSWEEMMIGFFDVVELDSKPPAIQLDEERLSKK